MRASYSSHIAPIFGLTHSIYCLETRLSSNSATNPFLQQSATRFYLGGRAYFYILVGGVGEFKGGTEIDSLTQLDCTDHNSCSYTDSKCHQSYGWLSRSPSQVVAYIVGWCMRGFLNFFLVLSRQSIVTRAQLHSLAKLLSQQKFFSKPSYNNQIHRAIYKLERWLLAWTIHYSRK